MLIIFGLLCIGLGLLFAYGKKGRGAVKLLGWAFYGLGGVMIALGLVEVLAN